MLVTCPECNARISSEADPCPKCGLRYAGRRSKQFNEAVAQHDNGKIWGLLSFYVSDNLECPHCHHEFFISSIPAQVKAAEMSPGYAVEYRFQCPKCGALVGPYIPNSKAILRRLRSQPF